MFSIEFHKDFSPFKITTNEVGVDGLKLNLSLSKEALDALLFEPNDPDFCWKSRSDIKLYCEVERENDQAFKVFIRSDFMLYTICGRCLEPLDQECKLDFSIRMVEDSLLGDDSECSFDSAELLGEEPTVGYFSDRCIDLGLILRDQIFLQMPDYPQCSSNGLAQSCNNSLAQANENSQQNDNPFVKLFKK